MAAKNVACINTSDDRGTSIYNCHQNFRMGKCGKSQDASSSSIDNHNLCPSFYINSFDYKFVPNNLFQCSSDRMASFLFEDVAMGYLGNFDRSVVQGDIFIATAKCSPYVMFNESVDNVMAN